MGGNGCYTPVNLSANVGDKIIMTNTDSTGIHSFTSGTVDGFAPAPDGTFDTGVLMSGDSFEWTPTVSGEYPYYCILHAWQVGTITVN
jgi:plastocyanin